MEILIPEKMVLILKRVHGWAILPLTRGIA